MSYKSHWRIIESYLASMRVEEKVRSLKSMYELEDIPCPAKSGSAPCRALHARLVIFAKHLMKANGSTACRSSDSSPLPTARKRPCSAPIGASAHLCPLLTTAPIRSP